MDPEAAPQRLQTIERHILDQQERFPEATGRLTSLLYDIALSAKLIARETTRAGLANILGATTGINVHGEIQQKLDVYADEVIFRMNDHTRRVCVMASEEHDELRRIPDHHQPGYYVLIYDPLDGSSNIDVNASIGTIFAIHRKITPGNGHGTEADVLQPGTALVAAGYVVYGSSTMLVYSTGAGVHGFTLDTSVGEFLLSHPDIRIPSPGKYYSINHGYEREWTPGIRTYVRWCQAQNEPDMQPLAQRYIGSLVADFHRNLLRGGVFLYPGSAANPTGKLRLTYEVQPLAYIAAQAGGYASDGLTDILDLQPKSLHQCVPFFVGNRDLVEQLEQTLAEHDRDALARYRTVRDAV
ncbi:class 1 fructose-bisphosphatase [Aggregatilinea lenta]|uniref:class 1 fructose-bisphosphatase n=1 Tax=Aggregatilinea lenta TaxID=913108 RepID=UPI000E5BBCD3|nr:class 1 fructose-bisphosphatase [Aggregatilinea lenta]